MSRRVYLEMREKKMLEAARDDIKDDEYPPVRKNAAMLKALARMAAASGARWGVLWKRKCTWRGLVG